MGPRGRTEGAPNAEDFQELGAERLSSTPSLCLLRYFCLFTEFVFVSAPGPGRTQKGSPQSPPAPRAALGSAQGDGDGAEVWIGAGSALGIREIPLKHKSERPSFPRGFCGHKPRGFGMFPAWEEAGVGVRGFPCLELWNSPHPGFAGTLEGGDSGFVAFLRCSRSIKMLLVKRLLFPLYSFLFSFFEIKKPECAAGLGWGFFFPSSFCFNFFFCLFFPHKQLCQQEADPDVSEARLERAWSNRSMEIVPAMARGG